jgi:hypothetical protein
LTKKIFERRGLGFKHTSMNSLKQRFWSNYGLRDERYGQNTDNLTTGTISMARKLFDFMVEPIGIEPTTS